MTEYGDSPPPRPQRTLARRSAPYLLAWLILYLITAGAGPMVQVLVCAFALGLAMWQLVMRRFRLRWTGAMLIAVGLYLASWFQPYLLVLFVTWGLVIAGVVAEGGRVMVQRREQRSG
jgi:hypothetical protein